MNIFNSLGSNYNLNFVLKALFVNNKASYSSALVNFLEKKYQGKATLLYKGREAIELGLKSLSLPQGSYTAINGFTCFAVYEAIKNAGLNVEYLDIEKGQLNFSSQELEKHLKENPKIKVVITQNTLGYPCQIDEIAKICQEKKLILIEDLAHSVGTKYKNGEEAGSMGDFVVFSFSQDKIIDGISGGALIGSVNSRIHLEGVRTEKQLMDKFYPFLTFLIRKTYPIGLGKILHHILKNLKLLSGPMESEDQIQGLPFWYCNLINLAFANLSDNLTHRKRIALIYAERLDSKITSPKINNSISFSTNLRFPIFVNRRIDLIDYLAKNQIFVSDIWYDSPIAPKKYLSQTNYNNQCPNAQLASEEILNLPTHINISVKMAEKISQLINRWLQSK